MWNQISLDVPDDLKDAVIGELADCGVSGVWEESGDSNSTRLVAYFADRIDLTRIETGIGDIFKRSLQRPPVISQKTVENHDWTEEWRKSYTSFPIGNAFFVIPSWENSTCPEDRLPIRLDPGQAFGTGTHETTQLTMEALERWVESDHVVLDLGTGSGILALASRLLGARRVIACDIDPVAVHVAVSNIVRNGQHDVSSFSGSVDAVADDSVNLLLANLTSEVIIDLFPEFMRIVKQRGLALFSGILHEQREQVLEACRQHRFRVHEEITRGEWLVVVTESERDEYNPATTSQNTTKPAR